jgi:hypothetical protein
VSSAGTGRARQGNGTGTPNTLPHRRQARKARCRPSAGGHSFDLVELRLSRALDAILDAVDTYREVHRGR